MKRTHYLFAAGSMLLPLALIGCGGGSAGVPQLAGTTGTAGRGAGRATVTVKWPVQSKSASRLIPALSNSVVVVIKDGGIVLDSFTLARPQNGSMETSHTFESLPVKTLTASSSAYPNNDGTGIVQAVTSGPLAIAANQTAALTLTMGTTIVRIDVAGPNGELAVPVNGSVMLTATPRDATGAVVLTSPGNMHLECSDQSIASLSPSGLIYGGKSGTVTITATESEHNVVSTTEFNVGQLFVVGLGSKNINRLDNLHGANKTTLDTGLTGPFEVFVAQDNRIYVSDYLGNKVIRMDDWTGANKVTYSTGLNEPTGIFASQSAHIYIADHMGNRIVRMDDMNGLNRVEFSTGLSHPTHIYVDGNEKIYFVDWGNKRIIRMDDMSGANLASYSTGMSEPISIWVGKDNKIYVADRGGNKIVRMDDMSGTNQVSYSNGVAGPTNVITDDTNRIIFLDGAGKITRIDNMNGDNKVSYSTGVGNPYGLCMR